MPLYINGNNIPNTGNVNFNGTSLTKVIFNGTTVWEKQVDINLLSGFQTKRVSAARNDNDYSDDRQDYNGWRIWSYNSLLTDAAYTSIKNNINAYDDEDDWSAEDHLCLPWSGLAIPSASLINLSSYRYLTVKVYSDKTKWLGGSEVTHEIAFYNSSGNKVAAYFLQPYGPIYNTTARSNGRGNVNLSIPHASVSHEEEDDDDNFEWYDITHTNSASIRYYSQDLWTPVQYEIDTCNQKKNGYSHTYMTYDNRGYFYVALDIPSGITSGTVMMLDGYAVSGGGRGHTFNVYECILRQ